MPRKERGNFKRRRDVRHDQIAANVKHKIDEDRLALESTTARLRELRLSRSVDPQDMALKRKR